MKIKPITIEIPNVVIHGNLIPILFILLKTTLMKYLQLKILSVNILLEQSIIYHILKYYYYFIKK